MSYPLLESHYIVYPQLTRFSVMKFLSSKILLIQVMPKTFKMLKSSTAPSNVFMNSQLTLLVCRETASFGDIHVFKQAIPFLVSKDFYEHLLCTNVRLYWMRFSRVLFPGPWV